MITTLRFGYILGPHSYNQSWPRVWVTKVVSPLWGDSFLAPDLGIIFILEIGVVNTHNYQNSVLAAT